jgi:hypothetical protein
MVKSSTRLPMVLIVGLLCGGAARAEYMDWSYHWSVSPSPVLTSGTGSVTQTLFSYGSRPGGTRIPVAAVTTTSAAMPNHPDIYNKNFSLTLHLTDLATHKSGNLTFYGNIRGTLTYDSAHLYQSFRTPIEHLTLGHHTYWVRLPTYLRLMAPGSLVVPTYYASVIVGNVWHPRPPVVHSVTKSASVMAASIASVPRISASTPEPSGFVLGSLGAVLLSCFALWRIWG